MDDGVKNISKQYLRMYPLKDINWKHLFDDLPLHDYDKLMNFQNKLLQSTIYHPVAIKYAPTREYSRLFLKRIIAQIEELNLEVCEDLYSAYSELLSSLPVTACEDSRTFYRTYYLPSDLSITLKETKAICSSGTTGLFTWEASHVLIDWCSKKSEEFYGKNILELGAGLGLTGLAIIKSCSPASYTFTDTHTEVLNTLKENVLINLCEDRLVAENISEEKCTDYKEAEVSILQEQKLCATFIPPCFQLVLIILCESWEKESITLGYFV
ncbi:Protein fam86a [Halocaridina rubra]|uniref:Protein fam86a n=1 Tax=Halocaridina rubra TaxID=373956 RepID=A0AAN8ZYQ8_HALRR